MNTRVLKLGSKPVRLDDPLLPRKLHAHQAAVITLGVRLKSEWAVEWGILSTALVADDAALESCTICCDLVVQPERSWPNDEWLRFIEAVSQTWLAICLREASHDAAPPPNPEGEALL